MKSRALWQPFYCAHLELQTFRLAAQIESIRGQKPSIRQHRRVKHTLEYIYLPFHDKNMQNFEENFR